MFVGRLRRRAAGEVRSRLGDDHILAIDERANCFGVESRRATQIRGNGCLAATPEEVLFLMWLPRREIRITRDRITAVERVTSHLGKRIGQPLLLVRFIDDQGRPDSAAWYVSDLPTWETVLNA